MACSNGIRAGWAPAALLLLTICLQQQQAAALVDLPEVEVQALASRPPVTNWLLPSPADRQFPWLMRVGWGRIGSKLWTFLSTQDNDFVDDNGHTVPPALMKKRVYGPSVVCGRFARQWIRMPFHDCGTYDVGNTGSQGSSFRPRFGCNGSLRKEIAPCLSKGPECHEGLEARYDLATGKYLNETAFARLEAKYGKKAIDWALDTQLPRMENGGMAQSMAFFYQIKMEAQAEPGLALLNASIADIMMYAGMLAVAKCGGPQIEFQPGRQDAAQADAPVRLPNPVAPLAHTISYFWTNGLTNFDMVNLLSAHSTACFGVGCLDSTPNKLDDEWAKVLLDINSEQDPRICQFPREVVNVTLPTPVLSCAMPADVEISGRPDVAPYLRALAGQESITAAARRHTAEPSCPAQANSGARAGSCDSQPGVPPFRPFSLVSSASGSVNLCNRPGAVGCSTSQSAYNDAFASSYFKMSKMFALRGVNQGAAYGVQTQPCQPGLIKVGELIPPAHPDEFIPPMNPNPRCSCCPEPPPQRFTFARLPHLSKKRATAEGLAAPGEVDAAAGGAAGATGYDYTSYAEAWSWFNANVA